MRGLRKTDRHRVLAAAILVGALALVVFHPSSSRSSKAAGPAASLPRQTLPGGVVRASTPAHDRDAEQLYLKGRCYWDKRTPDDFSLKTGSGNLALGALAGSSLTGAESNNIYLGNVGVAGESQTARIGTDLTAVFIAGISGRTSASGVAVFINTAGQLGTLTSSRRSKHEIADMGAESDLLMKLRPVAFY